MSVYGYACISPENNCEDLQIDALKKFGAEEIFVDKIGNSDFNCPQYQKLLHRIEPEDVFVVKSTDSLGSNYAEILSRWHVLTKDKRASVVVLDMPPLDTRNKRDFIGMFKVDLTLHVLAAVSRIEPEFLRRRQAEGIAAAKARGVKLGRPTIKRPENYPEVHELWQAGKISARKAGRLLGVNYQTFLNWASADEQQA